MTASECQHVRSVVRMRRARAHWFRQRKQSYAYAPRSAAARRVELVQLPASLRLTIEKKKLNKIW
jgi:hypothetical protein